MVVIASSFPKGTPNDHHRPPPLPAGTWQLDAAHSSVSFSVRHMMVSKVRGQFTDFSADIVIAEDPLAVDGVNAVVQMASIDTGDSGRDEHLRTNDFFDIENHPTMTFRSTGLEGSGDDYKLHGDLTIKGVTKPGHVRPRGRRRRQGPVGQHQGRLHGDRHDQPQGLRPRVQRRRWRPVAC